jgi:SNF2 family DNA or RNA helicase
MGMGKTLQAIALVAATLAPPKAGASIVVENKVGALVSKLESGP